jgi:hypothetical protein
VLDLRERSRRDLILKLFQGFGIRSGQKRSKHAQDLAHLDENAAKFGKAAGKSLRIALVEPR